MKTSSPSIRYFGEKDHLIGPLSFGHRLNRLVIYGGVTVIRFTSLTSFLHSLRFTLALVAMGNVLSATSRTKASLPSAACTSDPSSLRSDTYSGFRVDEGSQSAHVCFPTASRVAHV